MHISSKSPLLGSDRKEIAGIAGSSGNQAKLSREPFWVVEHGTFNAGVVPNSAATLFSLSPCVLGRGFPHDGSCFPEGDTALILLASIATDGHA
jgi:hypothetical protein